MLDVIAVCCDYSDWCKVTLDGDEALFFIFHCESRNHSNTEDEENDNEDYTADEAELSSHMTFFKVTYFIMLRNGHLVLMD